jgi:hypothetical protein
MGYATLSHPTQSGHFLRTKQLPIAQRYLPVHPAGKIRVMGSDQRGDVFGADDTDQFRKHDVGGGDIEIAGGLIRQQQGGFVGERSGDRDALLFTARKFAGQMAGAGRVTSFPSHRPHAGLYCWHG